MIGKLLVLVLALVALLQTAVNAEMYFDRLPNKPEDLKKYGLKCIPGRTVIRVEEPPKPQKHSEEDARRTHMNYEPNDELCKICICSVEGKDEYCSRRPAKNVNECIRMSILNKLMHSNAPFSHEGSLSFRIRRVGDENDTCVPFVSEYSDCSEVNRCTGCNRCSCTAEGEWSCETVLECPNEEDALSDAGVSNAIDSFFSQIEKKEKKPRYLVPPPPLPEQEFIASPNQFDEKFKDFQTVFSRMKRSVNRKNIENSDNGNHTLKFYHTVDEIDEDTLKGLNSTGTIIAQKVEINHIPKISRRTNMYDNFNKSDLNALHIEYNQPPEYDHHISENKIESHHGDKHEYNEEKLNKILGNFSSANKDTILSKIVVNELKGGSEIIGDKEVSPMSNITFTPENDTLTAMAFIAGNLLNKLWNMEMEHADFSTETEVLKHEKINDLLDLFKEPLSIRQENFIKNALEKLSDTLSKNKNVKNVSLCETITDGETNSQESQESLKDGTTATNCIKNETTSKKSQDHQDKSNPPTEVISKLNNVLDLMKKFEQVQNSLHDLRTKTLTKPTKLIEKLPTKVTLTDPENSSLKLFGNLLEKITKLLIPNKKSKKVLGKLARLNQIKDNKSAKSLVENKYGINLNNKYITAKDKLIIDYLNHIENNPNCLLKKNLQNIKPKPSMNVEGNILYNLSEFFKVKSFIDLVKLLKPDIIPKTETTTEQKISTVLPKRFANLKKIDSLQEQKNFNDTKEKLKNHLRALIDDMIELQHERGINKEQTKMNIADALPCIYNILKANTINNEDNDKTKSRLDKIRNVLDTIKLELSSNSPLMTRRSNLIADKSQSAKNWERIIKNINARQRNTRRSFKEKPVKSYQELKNIIDRVELIGNSYKNFAMLSVVSPEKKLMLLKTLQADTRQEQKALEAIINSMQTIAELPLEKRSEIKEFIDNAANNINLSINVLNTIDKSKQKIEENPLVEEFNVDQNKKPINELDTQNISEILSGYKNNNNVKLTRDQIVKQLIEKRIEFYLKTQEEAGLNTSDDVNYNIGKQILFLMKTGNYNVAKELFKVFVANKHKEDNVHPKKRDIYDRGTSNINEQRTKGRLFRALKDPLIRFNEPAKDSQNQDHLFKQLLNFKNLS